jgi:signal transduction histidine kinase
LNSSSESRRGSVFLWTVVCSVLGFIVYGWVRGAAQSLPRGVATLPELLFWVVVVAGVELLPVPVSKRLQITFGFPILLAVAILYAPPVVAASVAFLGSFDSREMRREISVAKALFNRSQLALTMVASSAVFHAFASVRSHWYILLGAVLVATAAHYAVNVVLVSLALHLLYGVAFRDILSQLRVGSIRDFLLNYVGLGLVGGVIATLYDKVSLWSVVAFLLPLIFARQMFFRTMALEEASKILKDREQVLRALSNRMAEERQDERMQIAAYLHDDLAQQLFRLSLQVDMARKRLAKGEISQVNRHLEAITDAKQETSNMVRALIRDLHRSPIGRKGLGEAMESFSTDMARGSPTQIVTNVVEVTLPPPIQLMIYQITREAVMNALKHAEADHIWITLEDQEEGVALRIRDDGNGFDTAAAPPEGHFGSVMMRERAQITGGTFTVQSAIGEGTTITATFPPVWVEEGSKLEDQSEGEAGSFSRTPPVGSTTGPSPMPTDLANRAGPSTAEDPPAAEPSLPEEPPAREDEHPRTPVGSA